MTSIHEDEKQLRDEAETVRDEFIEDYKDAVDSLDEQGYNPDEFVERSYHDHGDEGVLTLSKPAVESILKHTSPDSAHKDEGIVLVTLIDPRTHETHEFYRELSFVEKGDYHYEYYNCYVPAELRDHLEHGDRVPMRLELVEADDFLEKIPLAYEDISLHTISETSFRLMIHEKDLTCSIMEFGYQHRTATSSGGTYIEFTVEELAKEEHFKLMYSGTHKEPDIFIERGGFHRHVEEFLFEENTELIGVRYSVGPEDYNVAILYPSDVTIYGHKDKVMELLSAASLADDRVEMSRYDTKYAMDDFEKLGWEIIWSSADNPTHKGPDLTLIIPGEETPIPAETKSTADYRNISDQVKQGLDSLKNYYKAGLGFAYVNEDSSLEYGADYALLRVCYYNISTGERVTFIWKVDKDLNPTRVR